ncbi:hypothetical protein CHLRE_12g494052v5 [Chlamydomonas reinhardtii]|uniref:Uncharacterized protein n=1 Tax=Chlamydomonas reinhardtii TaxID=3055 RepID=A0A2K3D1S9_CHLRE|nr:uncharacterized protein CHLRE_12g494052v5 [Chlamydomonas reinhardtii]PNW74496.1 hypothetical protein CHLRE_12g494052v5 [Chlamydomonas reinhardtii]
MQPQPPWQPAQQRPLPAAWLQALPSVCARASSPNGAACGNAAGDAAGVQLVLYACLRVSLPSGPAASWFVSSPFAMPVGVDVGDAGDYSRPEGPEQLQQRLSSQLSA